MFINSALVFLWVPMITHAGTPATFKDLVILIIDMFNIAVPILISIGVVFTMYGVVKGIYGSDNERTRAESRQTVLYSIFAIFVMVAFWGFVNVVTNTFFGCVGADCQFRSTRVFR